MMDPLAQMEMLEKGIETENPNIETPEGLTKEETIKIIMDANEVAFEKYKKLHH